jgi:hypothetical protein
MTNRLDSQESSEEKEIYKRMRLRLLNGEADIYTDDEEAENVFFFFLYIYIYY